MIPAIFNSDTYTTKPLDRTPFPNPSIYFFYKFLGIVIKSGTMAKRKKYGTEEWVKSSIDIFNALERAGVQFEISGMDNISSFDGPAVFIGNHMSSLETVILPSIIQPRKEVTFVVKQELLNTPYFGHILASRDPIIVGRSNPRDDLINVMENGIELLKKGRSIIIFPQRTRSKYFNPESFNSLGIKLAKRSNSYVVPISLLTDAWGNGKLIKDFGKIDPSKKVHFCFGKPFKVETSGSSEHLRVIDFITKKLTEWGREEYILRV